MDRKREAVKIVTRNFMDNCPRLTKQELLNLGYEEWAINEVLIERGEQIDKRERVETQTEAQL